MEVTTAVRTFKDIDRTILQAIPNPSDQAYEIKTRIPEFTFLGVKEQPDFAVIYLTLYPRKKVIELRSLKQYVFQLRNTIDSDWKARGGQEKFNDWQRIEDEWDVTM